MLACDPATLILNLEVGGSGPNPDAENDWFWLRKIYGLLAQPNFFLDWIVPISTVLLAVAAIYLAYRSYRASRDANEQAAQFRTEDRAERDLRWRRTFALDLRDWYWYANNSALLDEQGREQEMQAFTELVRACDLAGQDTAKRLARWLASEARSKRDALGEMTPQKRAQAMHPSQIGIGRAHLDLIDNWIKDPSLVEPMLDAFDADRRAEQARLLENLQARREKK